MIDLHLHSLYSDGELSPSDVVERAYQAGVSVLSLTDHDTISGLREAQKTATSLGINFIPGVELEAATNIGKSQYIHILGYNFKNYDLLNQYLDYLKWERIDLVKRYINLLNNIGYKTSFEEVTSLTPGEHLTVYHIAVYLSKVHEFDFNEARELFLDPGSKYYIPRHFYNVDFIINLILQSGGIPVLAHPCRLPEKGKELEKYVATLSKKGIKGIETYYPLNSRSETKFYEYLAEKYRLLKTAGSDWHSYNDNFHIGMSTSENDKIILGLLHHVNEIN